jgi:hypothetical protein
MRFSLKWLLIGTAYAAVAAAALTQDSWIWADIVWALSLVAFAFAFVVACLARGPRQAAGLGFVAFVGSYLLCLHFEKTNGPAEGYCVLYALVKTPTTSPSRRSRSRQDLFSIQRRANRRSFWRNPRCPLLLRHGRRRLT